MTRTTRTLFALALALVVAGSGYWFVQHRSRAGPVSAADFENEATEALLREIFWAEKTNRPVMFFLAYGQKPLTEPSHSFLARFAGQQPPVQSFDRAVQPGAGTPVDYATGRPGVVIQLAGIKRKSAREFEVEVVLSNRPPGRNRFTYELIQVGSEWRIRSREP